MIGELQNLNARIVYKTLKHIDDVRLCAFANAAQPTSRDYGQTGLIIRPHAWNKNRRRQLFYIPGWSSHKQKRVCHSSHCAEKLAAEAAEDLRNYFKSALNALFLKADIKHELNVDSKELWDNITTLHEGRGYRLHQNKQKLQNCFQSKELNFNAVDTRNP